MHRALGYRYFRIRADRFLGSQGQCGRSAPLDDFLVPSAACGWSCYPIDGIPSVPGLWSNNSHAFEAVHFPCESLSAVSVGSSGVAIFPFFDYGNQVQGQFSLGFFSGLSSPLNFGEPRSTLHETVYNKKTGGVMAFGLTTRPIVKVCGNCRLLASSRVAGIFRLAVVRIPKGSSNLLMDGFEGVHPSLVVKKDPARVETLVQQKSGYGYLLQHSSAQPWRKLSGYHPVRVLDGGRSIYWWPLLPHSRKPSKKHIAVRLFCDSHFSLHLRGHPPRRSSRQPLPIRGGLSDRQPGPGKVAPFMPEDLLSRPSNPRECNGRCNLVVDLKMPGAESSAAGLDPIGTSRAPPSARSDQANPTTMARQLV